MTRGILTALGFLSLACAGVAGDVPQLKEDYQVIQRNAAGHGSCVIVLPMAGKAADKVALTIDDGKRNVRRDELEIRDLVGGKRGLVLEGIPVGGPYTITVSRPGAGGDKILGFQNILVGDIWLLGGQSNMFGIDLIKEPLPSLPYVNMFNVEHIKEEGHWCAGLPPIHRIPEPFALFVLKAQHPEYSDEQIKKVIAAKTPVGGIDCSYFFARKLFAESRVPIGLIPCAVGGALAIWDPKDRAGNRYGFAIRHVKNVGGRVKGLLFFQGEQDAIFGDERETVTKPSLIYPIGTYGRQFKDFVETLRRDVGNPEMPAIFAQICGHYTGKKERDRGWETIREAQRRIPDLLPKSHCVATVDLEVMDGLHVDYDSLKRVGERMAYLALPYVNRVTPPRREIKLVSAAFGKTIKPTIVVEFSGVTGRLRAPGKPTGFSLKRKDTGESLPWIYKVEFDRTRPNVAILHVGIGKQEGLQLYYAAGSAPYANVVDDNDMALPAFGPIELN